MYNIIANYSSLQLTALCDKFVNAPALRINLNKSEVQAVDGSVGMSWNGEIMGLKALLETVE